MVQKFYTLDPVVDVPAELDDRYTPAEVMEALCTNFKDHRAALAQLMKHQSEPVQEVFDTIQHDVSFITKTYMDMIPDNTDLEEKFVAVQKARSETNNEYAAFVPQEDSEQDSQLAEADRILSRQKDESATTLHSEEADRIAFAEQAKKIQDNIESQNRRFIPNYAQFASMYNDGGSDGLASLDAAFAAPTFTSLYETL